MHNADEPVPTDALIAELAAVAGVHTVFTILAELRRRGISVDEAGRRAATVVQPIQRRTVRTRTARTHPRPGRGWLIASASIIAVVVIASAIRMGSDHEPAHASPSVTSSPRPSPPGASAQPPSGTEWQQRPPSLG